MDRRKPERLFALAIGALCSALFVGQLSVGSALAQHSSCRTDPVVTLSNRVQLTLYEDVSDVASDITRVTYALHLPSGVTVTSISYPGDVSSSLQSVTTYQDDNAGTYDAYTVVYTRTPNIPVTAYMSGTSAGGSTVSAHTGGHSGQVLHSHLHLT